MAACPTLQKISSKEPWNVNLVRHHRPKRLLQKHRNTTVKSTRKKKGGANVWLSSRNKKLATEAANVEVDKGGASNKHDTLEVGGGSNYCPPTIGMHKLPAIVSSQRTKIKPIIRKPIISKNNTVGETKNINEPSDKESIVEEKLNTKAVVKSRESQVGKEDEVDNQQLESSQFIKSPKVQLALKRQKRLESPSSTFPEAPNIDNTEPSNDRDPGRKDIKKLSKDSSKPKASRKDSTDNVSPVDKASAVGLDTPETSVSADVTPASSSTVAVPKVSSLRFEFASELTEPLPTTETRKQLLRQLNSEITEKKVPTPPNPAQEGVLVPVCIGSDDLIQDKIMNVVEGIVKVKVEMIESVKKKDSSSKLPTAGELDEYFLEIFGNDTPPIEKDDPSARGSADKSDLEKSLTASDTQACSSNFVVSDTKTVDTGLNEKSESNVQAPQDLNYESGRNAHHGSQEKTDSPTINTSASNGLLRTPVNQSKTGSNNSGASYDVAEVSNESTALGDREPAAVSPAVGSVTPGKTETDKSNTGINTEKEVPDVEDDTFVISSQESDVEVVDVGSSSQKNSVPRSRRLKKHRRVVDELVPTIAALSIDRTARGNRLLLLRKMMAQRLSSELFSPMPRNRSKAHKRDRKHIFTHSSPELPRGVGESDIHITKHDLTESLVEREPECSKSGPITESKMIQSAIDGIKSGSEVVTNPEIAESTIEVTTHPTVELIAVDEPDHPNSVVEATEPAETQTSVEIIEIEEDSQPPTTDVVFISEEQIPFLEDEEYPPKSVPQPLPVEMPRPIVSLNCRPMDDDVVVIEPATPGQSCSLNAGSKSNDALQGPPPKGH
uniref:Uncharacterized protein n=1 Tax=Lygus hesperus TaxID=30085 RepID=A0A0A9VU92_LYGHE